MTRVSTTVEGIAASSCAARDAASPNAPRAGSDEELMRFFQDGNAEAFASLYGRYKKPIFVFLLRQCKSPSAAGDLTQDTFTRVVRSAGGFRHGARFSTWLYTIARNVAVDAARKQKHRDHRSLDQPVRPDGPALAEKISGADPQPDRLTTSKRLQKDLEKAIAALPEDQREVFLMREYAGLPFREIAQIVDVREGTVKSRMRYALESLRQQLCDYADYARTLS